MVTKKQLIVGGSLVVLAIAASVYASAADIDISSSISPHESGVCAPNIACREVIEDDAPQDIDTDFAAVSEEPDDVYTEPEAEPTLEEQIKANRDPESDIWHDIDADQCPGHEWEYHRDGVEDYRACVNCGMVELLPMPEEPEVDEPEPVEGGTPDEDTADESDMEIVEGEADEGVA